MSKRNVQTVCRVYIAAIRMMENSECFDVHDNQVFSTISNPLTIFCPMLGGGGCIFLKRGVEDPRHKAKKGDTNSIVEKLLINAS